MSAAGDKSRFPPSLLEPDSTPPRFYSPPPPSRRSLVIAVLLFFVTLLTCLAAGAQFAAAYQNGQSLSLDDYVRFLRAIFTAPRVLLPGLPFALTLMTILLAHELGHWFACRHHSIRATYPFFIPAPTLIGTLGAFILIRSPMRNRRALFDVGFSGPIVGLVLAAPPLVYGILHAKVVPGLAAQSDFLFGDPLLVRLLETLLRPRVAPQNLLLHPIGRAAWVGLLATALNLLPAGQLDGGHILNSVSSRLHRWVTWALPLALLVCGRLFWSGWYLWSCVLFLLAFRRPPIIDQWQPLDRGRLLWALVALMMFLLCFMPAPIYNSPFSPN